MEDAAFRAFLRSAFICLDSVMKPGAPFYIWHADSEGYNFRGACRDVGWQVRQCIIWNKNSFVLGRQDYQWKHEPCLYGWKDGAVHYFIDNRSQATVYQDQEELEPRKMTKKRVKKPKAKHPSDRLSTENVIRYTQYLCLASVLLTLWGVYGVQEQEKAEEFLESYVSFLEEKMDGRNSIGGIVEDCIDMTGFDPITIIDKIYERRSEVKRK